MKTINVITVLFVLAVTNIASAKITIVGPVQSIKSSACLAADGGNQLRPFPLKYVSPPDAESAVQRELADPNADTDFSGWTINEGVPLSGIFTVDYYNSKFVAIHQSGSQIRARYTKGPGDPDTLRWVQLVDSTQAINNPAEKYPIIDPAPEDEPNSTNPDPAKYRPFYYNEEEIADRTGGADYDLKFYDFPTRSHPPTGIARWEGTLYLSSWDGNTPGTVTLHGGIQYGFVAGCLVWEDWPGFEYVYDLITNIGLPPFEPVKKNRLMLPSVSTDGTIKDVTCNMGGIITTDGNMIEINWDPPLDTNSPVEIVFTANEAFLELGPGMWFLDSNAVGDVNSDNAELERIGPTLGYCNAFISMTGVTGATHPGTAYRGRWWQYPFTGLWTAWFDNGPFEEPGAKKINVKLTAEPIDPCQPAYLNVTIGYAKNNWHYTLNSEPPLPMFIPDLTTENMFIFRDPTPIYNGPVTGVMNINGSLESAAYNPEWTSISVQGQNIKIGMAMINHDDPYHDPLGGADTDGDNTVGLGDLALMKTDWQNEGTKFESDINGDEIIDLRDYAIFAAHFGQSE